MSRRQERKINHLRRKINNRRIINQDILRISIFFAVLFFALMIYMVCFIAFDSTAVINNTYNKRTDTFKELVDRGKIISADGQVLAYTEKSEDGSTKRVYPYGDTFAHVVGFESMGGLGIESSYNYYLLTSHANIFDRFANEFAGIKSPGDTLVTTLDTGLQKELQGILNGYEGAIVALDPMTGEVKGMYSNPGFDPNTVEENWEQITADEDSGVLLNRVTQGLFTPGSTFKVFTLMEYYREHPEEKDTFLFDCEGTVDTGSGFIKCFSDQVHGEETLKEAFKNSCNCAFSTIGSELDIHSFRINNEQLLFNTPLDIDIAANPSRFELTEDSSKFMIMQTSFGQGETLCSPMHLAMIASAAANNGVLMKPHLVKEVQNYKGNHIKSFNAVQSGRLFAEDEAAFLKEYMRAVITDGTAQQMSYDGNYYAYGKTGTAETKSDKETNYDHSWFMGFAENNGTYLVVCAMIENTQEAGITGTYAAKCVFDYYFN
ncbi:MAG: penicillin-binding protein 2 [Parasporobacterium sp.]|nr:penicillin-binding protein 2 [Parasporobacterium sp.]